MVPREPDPSHGLFFLGLDGTILEDEQEALPLPLLRLPPEQQGVLDAVEAIGVRAGVQDERSSRYDIFVKIRRP